MLGALEDRNSLYAAALSEPTSLDPKAAPVQIFGAGYLPAALGTSAAVGRQAPWLRKTCHLGLMEGVPYRCIGHQHSSGSAGAMA